MALIATATAGASAVGEQMQNATDDLGTQPRSPFALPPPSSLPPVVAMFGDSLGFEATDAVSEALDGRAIFASATVPGAALCDVVTLLDKDPRRIPDVAIIQFSGNNLTDCMRDGDDQLVSDDAVVDKYASDAEGLTALLRARQARVYFSSSPRTPTSDRANRINDRYRELAARWSARGDPVFFIDAARSVLNDDGSFADRLGCMAIENPQRGCRRDGTIRVRSTDGVHFCPEPTAGVRECPVWSSGAHRFGMAIGAAVSRDVRVAR